MTGKRERLVEAARVLVYRQGYLRTTLAEVAELAGVPVGNVYYYFRTKDELLRTVIEAHKDDLRARLAELDSHPDPRERLKSLVRLSAADATTTAELGCPYGSINQELTKSAPGIQGDAAELLDLQVRWARRQFEQLGCAQAAELAVDLVCQLEGASLLTSAFRSPELLKAQAGRLESWIDRVS